MIDPQLVADAFRTTSVIAPTRTSIAPIPTVVPDVPHFERVGETGTRTLWVLFVLMFLTTLTFGSLAWRMPTVRSPPPLKPPH
jgi:hypothetical protein